VSSKIGLRAGLPSGSEVSSQNIGSISITSLSMRFKCRVIFEGAITSSLFK